MISLFDLFKHYGLIPDQIKLVRHGNKELSDILRVYREKADEFEAYQSIQKPRQFDKAAQIASFAPTKGTTALFLGIWDINSSQPQENFTLEQLKKFQEFKSRFGWNDSLVWYELNHNQTMSELSERLIIDWGKATVSWVQQNQNKQILEIRAEGTLNQFRSYADVQLSYSELKQLIIQSTANAEWISKLSAVKGVYLIRHKPDGKLYVGSAYGENGILGRWKQYAKSGHGNNQNLIQLDHHNLEFSILETLPFDLDDDEVIARESRWKDRLGTRLFGLNCN